MSTTYDLGPGTMDLAGKTHEIASIKMTVSGDIPKCDPVKPQTQEWAEEIMHEFQCAKDLHSLLNVGTVFHSLRYAPEVQRICFPVFQSRVKEFAPEAWSERVVVVDLSAIYHASFSVCEGKPETTQHTLQMLRNIYATTKPTHFIIAQDHKSNWRREFFSEYKADRPSKPRNFGEFLKEVIVELKTKNIQIEEREGYESDDVMASIAFRSKLLNQPCILVSEDMDLWQCLGGKVQQFRFKYDHKEYRDAAWLAREHKIAPRQAVDWLCMVGKNNIKGAYKIGKKTASDWLEKYGSFIGIWEAREELTEAKRLAVEAFMDDYWNVRKLHTLNVELDIFWQAGTRK